MRLVYFTHSLLSCWNHGNAHFLRGVLRELQGAGHAVAVYEPEGAWSLVNLLRDHGEAGLAPFRAAYPTLASVPYGPDLDLDAALAGADVVVVHEWNEPGLVARIGARRARGAGFRLLFHDTHHRAVSDPDAMRAYRLDGYDGVLAFGEAVAEIYRGWGWRDRVFVWHEAADTALFHPPAPAPRTHGLPSPLAGEGGPRVGEGRMRGGDSTAPAGVLPSSDPAPPRHLLPQGEKEPRVSAVHDSVVPPSKGERRGLVWIGNWGDEERSAELEDYLFRPAARLGLPLDVYGVRYPEAALATLARHGARYHGWAPNAGAPAIFARHLATAHVPRRYYTDLLPGVPTIRVFEALACGIPLVSAPWRDSEGLFRVGQDFLMARDPAETERHLRAVRDDPDLRAALVRSGLETIAARHTCRHRAEELVGIVAGLGARIGEPA